MNQTIVNLPKPLVLLASLWLVFPFILTVTALIAWIVLQISPVLGQAFGMGLVLYVVTVLYIVTTLLMAGG